MVKIKKLGSGGHTEIEVSMTEAIEFIRRHLSGYMIVVDQKKTSDPTEIREDSEVLIVPLVIGG